MNENVEKLVNELTKGAELLGMTEEEASAKVDEICLQQGLNKEEDALLVLSLWRQYFSSVRMAQKQANPDDPASSSTTSSNWMKSAFGVFIAVDEARDMMEIQRRQVKNEYMRDAATCLSMGKIALIVEKANDPSSYTVTRVHDGEEQVKDIENLPPNKVEVEGGWIVPLDAMKSYGTDTNPHYGKPLPQSEFRRNGIFIGEVDGVFGRYYFNYKGESCKEFSPTTFEYVHFVCIINRTNPNKIHGITNKTLASLMYNVDIPDDSEAKKDTSNVSVSDVLMQTCEDNYSPLLDLDRYHSLIMNKDWDDRYVFTDGSVSSMNMTPTSNGNRILSITDLNADFDYEGDGWSGTTCWIPPHIDINFGIGSSVVVVGRTSQRTDDEGALESCTINVTGLLVTDNRGKSMDTVEIPVEEDTDWF
tara:strand:- start:4219 stop:5475 length:1257 start_codon:yes stop_codon:yes gene_type:complete